MLGRTTNSATTWTTLLSASAKVNKLAGSRKPYRPTRDSVSIVDSAKWIRPWSNATEDVEGIDDWR